MNGSLDLRILTASGWIMGLVVVTVAVNFSLSVCEWVISLRMLTVCVCMSGSVVLVYADCV